MKNILDIYRKKISKKDIKKKTNKESIELLKKARNGCEKSFNDLVENHLMLVYKMAIRMAGTTRAVQLEDMIQEGNLGLLKAIEMYDLEKKTSFASYAGLWIQQHIIRNCIMNSRTVRLPENIQFFLRSDRYKGPEDWKEYSIDLPYDDGSILSDKLPGDDYDNFFKDEEQKIISKKVEYLLSFLDPRDSQILRSRFGIGDDKPLTPSETAKKFDMSVARVNRIINTALTSFKGLKKDLGNIPKIVSATYGTETISIDVTDEVRLAAIKNKKIRSSNRLGGDPCKGKRKTLCVKYFLNGKIATKKIREGSYLEINF